MNPHHSLFAKVAILLMAAFASQAQAQDVDAVTQATTRRTPVEARQQAVTESARPQAVTPDNYRKFLQGTFDLHPADTVRRARKATRFELLTHTGNVLNLIYRDTLTGHLDTLQYIGWHITPLRGRARTEAPARMDIRRGRISATRVGEQMNFPYDRLTPDSFLLTVHDSAPYWAVRVKE